MLSDVSIYYFVFFVLCSFVGASVSQEMASTYFETDLNTGDCRDIALKPKPPVAPTAKLPPSESLHVAGVINSSLPGVGSTPTIEGPVEEGHATFSQYSRSPASGHHDGRDAQKDAAVRHPTSGTTVIISTHSGVTRSAGFPSYVQQFPSSVEPRGGVYSVASSRPSVRQGLTQPGTDTTGIRGVERVAHDAHQVHQHGQIGGSRENASGIQHLSSGRPLAANVLSASYQVSCIAV